MPSPKTYKQFHTFFSPLEWKRIIEKSQKLNMKPTRYIRWISLFGEIKKYDTEKILKLTLAVNRYNNNLNQIAKVANSTNSIYEADIDKLKSDMEDLKDYVEMYLDELKYDLV